MAPFAIPTPKLSCIPAILGAVEGLGASNQLRQSDISVSVLTMSRMKRKRGTFRASMTKIINEIKSMLDVNALPIGELGKKQTRGPRDVVESLLEDKTIQSW